MIVEQQVNKMFGDDKQLLKFAFESVIESLQINPYRLQSFIEYSMSAASTSNLLCNPNNNGYHERQPRFYSQCYLSPNYDSDRIQVDHLKKIILNESERFYEQKVEELKNQTICEAAAYGNNKITD